MVRMDYTFTPMTERHARTALAWQYRSPFAYYNNDPDHLEKDLRDWVDPEKAYFSIVGDQDALIGYCCFGTEAQVPGGLYEGDDTIDIGAGMRPDLMGTDLAPAILEAILTWAKSVFSPLQFRVTVATFNKTVIRLCSLAGFEPELRFMSKTYQDERKFLIMTRKA